MKPTAPNQLAACLRAYFTDHLPRLRGLSPNTVLSTSSSPRLKRFFPGSIDQVRPAGGTTHCWPSCSIQAPASRR